MNHARFSYAGQPNRLRPADYRRAFERCGWRDVVIRDVSSFDSRGRAVSRRFRRGSDLGSLTIVLTATWPRALPVPSRLL